MRKLQQIHGGGPQTPQGKTASSRNAVKHGLCCQQIVLPHENADAFSELRDQIKRELKPDGPIESELVEQIVGLIWRLRRVAMVETGIFAYRQYRILQKRAQKRAAEQIRITSPIDDCRTMYERTETLDLKLYEEALQEQRQQARNLESEIATLGEAFVRDCQTDDSLSKLSRYETTLHRSLTRALFDFKRLRCPAQEKETK